MSDYIYASINIGGDIPESLIPELANKLINENFENTELDVNTHSTDVDEWVQAIRACDNECAIECNGLANYGNYNDLEKWLCEHDISFLRSSDAGLEYDGEYVWHERGTPPDSVLQVCKSAGGQEVVPINEVISIVGAIKTIKNAEEAALHLQDDEDSETHELAMYILRKGMPDSMEYLEHRLKEKYPEPPYLSDLHII